MPHNAHWWYVSWCHWRYAQTRVLDKMEHGIAVEARCRQLMPQKLASTINASVHICGRLLLEQMLRQHYCCLTCVAWRCYRPQRRVYDPLDLYQVFLTYGQLVHNWDKNSPFPHRCCACIMYDWKSGDIPCACFWPVTLSNMKGTIYGTQINHLYTKYVERMFNIPSTWYYYTEYHTVHINHACFCNNLGQSGCWTSWNVAVA